MSIKKIVITGGPGTGKTSIIKHLKSTGYSCFQEVSRQVTLQAREQGIEQLFLEDPLLFSQKILEGRINQFLEADNSAGNLVFLDRGIPDVLAYMDYIGDPYPDYFMEACKTHQYNTVFLLPPWEAIYEPDNERYEDFEQASVIHGHLKKTYEKYGYEIFEVPIGTVDFRADFIVKHS